MSEQELSNTFIKLRPDLNRYARFLTKDRNDALDLIQDTYFKAYKFKGKLTHYSNIKGWMFSVMKRNFLDMKKLPSSERSCDVENIRLVERDTPESLYNATEIENFIAQLSDHYRVPFQLVVAGYTYPEIAVKLNKPLGTIKSDIFRARKRLMKEFKKYGT